MVALRRRWGAGSLAVAASLLLLACDPSLTGKLNWAVHFACTEDAAASDRVTLQIVRGHCPGGGDIVYETSVGRSDPAADQGARQLPPGEYAVVGSARTADGVVVAEGCVTTSLPSRGPIDLLLKGRSGPKSQCTRPPRDKPNGDAGPGVHPGVDATVDPGVDATVDPTEVDSGTITDPVQPEVDSGTLPVPVPHGWIAQATMPYGSGGLAAAVLSDGVHVLGGSSDFGGDVRARQHFLYVPSSDRWETSPAQVPDDNTWGAQAQVHGNKLYLAGGYPSGDYLLRVYDPASNRWTSLPDIPDAFSYGFASAVTGGFLYLIGGRDQDAASAHSYKYNFSSGAWSPIAPIPQNEGRGSLAAAIWNNTIYVINGDAPGGTTSLQVYDVAANQWSSGPKLASHHEGAAGAALAGELYFFGGIESVYDAGGAVRQTLNIYDVASKSWSTGANMGTGRFRLSAVPVDDAIYVFGGFIQSQLGTSLFDVYRP